MKLIIACALVAVAAAITNPPITGTTPPAIPCPNSLCQGKYDGNFALKSHRNYFLQCVGGNAYCQACFPLSLEFSQRCNQCLYNRKDECVTTQKWEPATTFACPDKCPARGPDFTGNIKDDHEPRQYVACWKGVTVGCIACPGNLKFNEKENACLYEGKYLTAPY
ncbi:uncharacterized protein [Clytia hemisphaerica]|uniref:Chitin-binding type-2 domain-containing protein n=1 Tax=Clytia hemisphaerica TaxID=252671 RepID=A0A7M5U0M5_9CNID